MIIKYNKNTYRIDKSLIKKIKLFNILYYNCNAQTVDLELFEEYIPQIIKRYVPIWLTKEESNKMRLALGYFGDDELIQKLNSQYPLVKS